MALPSVQDGPSVGYELESGSDNSSTLPITVSATGANTLLVVWMGSDSSSDKTIGLSSDLGDTFTKIGDVAGGASSQDLGIWVKQNPSSGTHTLTLTWTAGSSGESRHMGAVVWANVDSYGTVATDSGSDTAVTAGDATAGSNDIIFGVGCINGNPTLTMQSGSTALGAGSWQNGGASGAWNVASYQDGSGDDSVGWSWTGSQRTGFGAFKIVGTSTTTTSRPVFHRAARYFRRSF